MTRKTNPMNLSLILGSLAFLLAVPATLSSQTPSLPAQLGTAKTIFLANAGEEANNVNEQAYAELSTALTQWGHYQLTAAPASAELIFELHYISAADPANVTNGNSFPSYTFHLRLDIIDRATHAKLWSVTEFITPPNRKLTADQALGNAIDLLLSDIKALSSGQMPSVAAAAAAKAKK